MINQTKLRALAEKATPGPWSVSGMRMNLARLRGGEAHSVGPDGDAVALVFYEAKHHAQHWADARFIAAVNPAAVLALLNERDALARAYEDEAGNVTQLIHENGELQDALAAARRLLSAWRYAKAFAGAEAWDGGHDMKQRFDLVDSVTELTGIKAAETLDEFRAVLGQARAEGEGRE